MCLFYFILAKILHELILPVDKRIADVREFLMSIDSSLSYDIVPIQDPYGPTQSDPKLDVSICKYFFVFIIYLLTACGTDFSS